MTRLYNRMAKMGAVGYLFWHFLYLDVINDLYGKHLSQFHVHFANPIAN
ncbi:hypothetical protein ACWF7H_02965 [Peribacillus butanolivorans]